MVKYLLYASLSFLFMFNNEPGQTYRFVGEQKAPFGGYCMYYELAHDDTLKFCQWYSTQEKTKQFYKDIKIVRDK